MSQDRSWIRPGVIAWTMVDFSGCERVQDLDDLKDTEGRVVIVQTDRGLAMIDLDGCFEETKPLGYSYGKVSAKLITETTELYATFGDMIREAIRQERRYATNRLKIAKRLESILIERGMTS